MNLKQRTHPSISFLTIAIILLGLFSLAFVQPSGSNTTPAVIPDLIVRPAATAIPKAMVNFKLTIPPNTPLGEGIYLYVLDEVTGLALNPQRTLMRANDPTHYMISIPVPVGSLLRYRYGRQSTMPADEMTADGKSIPYRLYRVDGPSLVQDTVARWTDTPFVGKSGRIQGIISDGDSRKPIPNLIVTCGGVVAKTAANGSYTISGLPVGAQNLVAISRDGRYRSFQQGAIVADNSVTPASFSMEKAKMVSIVFTVNVPEDTPAEANLRMAGNISQLGNTFSSPTLYGEVDIIHMPKLVGMGNRRYALALQLPAGTDLRYKYSLGDNFWNAERNNDGTLYIRQLIIPEESRVVDDQIDSWSDSSREPLGFEYRPPAGSKPGAMNIQFYLSGWTQPIPLWNSPDNRLTYILYSPLKLVGKGFKYRFCSPAKCTMK
jgi:hypothetical protein